MGNKQRVLCKAGILRHDTIVPDYSRGKSDTTGVELNCFLGLHHVFCCYKQEKPDSIQTVLLKLLLDDPQRNSTFWSYFY